MTYAEWIADYVAKNGTVLGACAKATQSMVEAFPELRRVPGHVYAMGAWGRRAHWWCETPDGEIVDPTVSQFPGGVVDYEPFVPGTEIRVGRCMNCGEDIHERVERLDVPPPHRYFCNDACSEAMAKEVGW